ncbi:MAG: tetratricopeptide repeat protein [Planctomycetota bacterium]|jgi:tetratricopeptide (TPR) repeat protein
MHRRPPAGKSVLYLVISVSVIAVIAGIVLIAVYKPRIRVEDILTVYQDDGQYTGLSILYPLNETLFPPEIVPPVFRWKDDKAGSDTWLVTIKFRDDKGRMNFITSKQQFRPKAEEWEVIKKRSLEKEAEFTVLGVNHSTPQEILSGGRISISTSKDVVGAPLFYREVDLPFVDAVKDPSRICWRFGSISSPRQPPVILEKLPVCGNCHSFTADSGILAMDVDYANSKGSYVITRVAEEMVLATSDIITWNDYRKEDGEQTFGLLSQVSPDGKVVVSTVKDKSVFVPMPPLAFSQLFFPIKGILCLYNRQTQTFKALPGADDPNFVQSNPSWSPDGKHLVFARAKAYDLKNTKGKLLLTREECKEFTEGGKPFLFDLYRIPFNDGKGGIPEPLEGASNNGMSNYFAKYSPDGKWIVFCKAKSYMLLQPDSELYIIPAEGGKAERLRANTSRMNSWHSFSPNSRWLVFSSKANSPYTQLFLTHIDEQGQSTPAILLEHFTAPDRAANIPEFINAEPTAIKKIREQFLNDYSFVRAGNAFFKQGEADNAIAEYRKALKINPHNVQAHLKMGFLLCNVLGNVEEGVAHLTRALELDPDNAFAHHDLGMALLPQKKFEQAVKHLSQALQHMPEGVDKQYNAVAMHHNLGLALFYCRKFKESTVHLYQAVRLAPDNGKIHYDLAAALASVGNSDDALSHYSKALSLKPDVDKSPILHHFLSESYAKAGQFQKAVLSAEKALNLARAAGDMQLVRQTQERIEYYQQQLLRERMELNK